MQKLGVFLAKITAINLCEIEGAIEEPNTMHSLIKRIKEPTT